MIHIYKNVIIEKINGTTPFRPLQNMYEIYDQNTAEHEIQMWKSKNIAELDANNIHMSIYVNPEIYAPKYGGLLP